MGIPINQTDALGSSSLLVTDATDLTIHPAFGLRGQGWGGGLVTLMVGIDGQLNVVRTNAPLGGLSTSFVAPGVSSSVQINPPGYGRVVALTVAGTPAAATAWTVDVEIKLATGSPVWTTALTHATIDGNGTVKANGTNLVFLVARINLTAVTLAPGATSLVVSLVVMQ